MSRVKVRANVSMYRCTDVQNLHMLTILGPTETMGNKVSGVHSGSAVQGEVVKEARLEKENANRKRPERVDNHVAQEVGSYLATEEQLHPLKKQRVEVVLEALSGSSVVKEARLEKENANQKRPERVGEGVGVNERVDAALEAAIAGDLPQPALAATLLKGFSREAVKVLASRPDDYQAFLSMIRLHVPQDQLKKGINNVRRRCRASAHLATTEPSRVETTEGIS